MMDWPRLETLRIGGVALVRSGVERGDPFAVLRRRPVGSGIEAGERIRAANWPTVAAVADEAVADDAYGPDAEIGVVAPEADGQDAGSMEHERQSRLRRWQAPPVR
jgi:hypothetical protein